MFYVPSSRFEGEAGGSGWERVSIGCRDNTSSSALRLSPPPLTTPVFTFALKTSCPFNFCRLIAPLKIAAHFRIHEIISRASPHSAVICRRAKIQIIFGLRVHRDESAERKRK